MADEDTSYLYEDLYGGAEKGIPGLVDDVSKDDDTSTYNPPPRHSASSSSSAARPIATFDSERSSAAQTKQEYEQRESRYQGPYTPSVGVSRDSEERPVNVRPSDMPDEGRVLELFFLFLCFFVSLCCFGFFLDIRHFLFPVFFLLRTQVL
jgi:hypothetical protein